MKNRKKGILAIVMVVTMLMLVACGSKQEVGNTPTNKLPWYKRIFEN